MRAVITAGGRIGGAYAAAAGTTVKALAPVRGVTLLRRAIDAARGAGAREIAVVATAEARPECAGSVERVIDASDDGARNVLAALAAWPDDDALLYLTSDLPYVTHDALEDFVSRSDGTLAMSLSSFDAFVRRFPGAPHTGIRIGAERVANGGAFLIPAGAAARAGERAAAFFRARKHPLRMARIAGVGILVRYIAGQLTIEALERRASRTLGLPVQAVRDCAPELAFDADELAEYEYAREHA